MQPLFFRNRYLKVILFKTDKTQSVYYIKPISDIIYAGGLSIKLNSDHIFYSNRFKTIIATNESAQSINPLDFKSKFSVKEFNTAINNNLVKDTFETLKDNKIEWLKIILFGNLLVNAVLLYVLLKQSGVLK